MAEPGNLSTDAQPVDARPKPNEKLVKVFDSEQESEALVVKGLLDSAGIDSDLTSASMVQEAFPGLGGMLILVREEDEEAARRVIAAARQSSMQPETDDDTTAEIAIIEEPPRKA
jgi:Putative prokaryotic signal transducing protein